MQILISKNEYVFVKVNLLSPEEIARLICNFLEPNSILLFSHLNYNTDLLNDETKKQEVEFCFEGFCLGIMKHHYDETRIKVESDIKNILLNYFYPEKTYSPDEIVDRLREKLFLNFIDGGFNKIDNMTLERIKDLIFLSFWNEKRLDIENFVNERKVFDNYETSSKFNEHNVIWYKPITIDEIKYIIEIERHFDCIVLNSYNLNDFVYKIKCIEFSEDDRLVIEEKIKGTFMKYVYPRLAKNYENVKCILNPSIIAP